MATGMSDAGQPFDLEEAIEILARTPRVLDALLGGLSRDWVMVNEGGETWSPFDVVGHLIHGEETDWVPRARMILEHGEKAPFEPFDRFAHLERSKGKTLDELLATFSALREENLAALRRMRLGPGELELTGKHPDLGTVTLRQLLATWAVHDFAHLGQIARAMANRYREVVGPWAAYIRILGDRDSR